MRPSTTGALDKPKLGDPAVQNGTMTTENPLNAIDGWITEATDALSEIKLSELSPGERIAYANSAATLAVAHAARARQYSQQ
jgi:hypothetical protein